MFLSGTGPRPYEKLKTEHRNMFFIATAETPAQPETVRSPEYVGMPATPRKFNNNREANHSREASNKKDDGTMISQVLRQNYSHVSNTRFTRRSRVASSLRNISNSRVYSTTA